MYKLKCTGRYVDIETFGSVGFKDSDTITNEGYNLNPMEIDKYGFIVEKENDCFTKEEIKEIGNIVIQEWKEFLKIN